jgi:Immunity protein 10
MGQRKRRRWVPDVLRNAGEDENDNGYVVGVQESLDPESWSLMFMASNRAADEQEISLGWDTYCLVVDPGQCTVYGGVVECELSDDRLILRLTERAAEALGTPTDLSFVLALDPTKLEVLRQGLRRVLTSGRANAVPQRLVV